MRRGQRRISSGILYILDDITLCDVFSTHWDDPSFLRERFYSFIIPMVNCFCDRTDNFFLKVDIERKLEGGRHQGAPATIWVSETSLDGSKVLLLEEHN